MRPLLGALLCLSALAAASPAGALFLTEEPDARALAAGGAYAAVPGGVASLRYNPAGLAAVDGWEAALSHHRQAIGWNREWLGAGLAWGPARLAGEFLYSAFDPIQDYDAAGNPSGSIRVADQSAGLGAAYRAGGGMSVGVVLRGFASQVAGYSNAGWSADVGALFQPEDLPVSLGVSMQNLGSQSAYISVPSPLPWGIRAGLAWTVVQRGGLGLDLRGDYDHFPDARSVAPWRAGVEARLGGGLSVMGGLQASSLSRQWTFGVGYRWRMLDFSYAGVPDEVFGLSHLISLRLAAAGP